MTQFEVNVSNQHLIVFDGFPVKNPVISFESAFHFKK